MDRPCFLGLDTSNYTTSAAIYEPESSTICHNRSLLPVGEGELGLRQSDALFHHVRQLPEVLSGLMEKGRGRLIEAVCASTTPRSLPGSYMPCFLAGSTVGQAMAQARGAPFYATSHQNGHLAAALWSAGRLDLIERPFLAFHVSGGTFEALRIKPSRKEVFSTEVIAATLDISAGQLIDRVGKMLGLGFPAGPKVEELARRGKWEKRINPTFRGRDCCLSGMENKAGQLLEQGTAPEDVCRFVLEYLAAVLCRMAEEATEEGGEQPIVFSGGVMSNGLLRETLSRRFCCCCFGEREFSSDNAAGVAVLGSIFHRRQRGMN